jgi:hypothetical protein
MAVPPRTLGVAIIGPRFTGGQFRDGSVHLRVDQSLEELKVARVGHRRVRGNLSVLDERPLVAEKGRGISYYKDRQVLGLFKRRGSWG